jgi:hypothetical protein
VANFRLASSADRVRAEVAVDGGSQRGALVTHLLIHSESDPHMCTVTGAYEEQPPHIAIYRVIEGPPSSTGSPSPTVTETSAATGSPATTGATTAAGVTRVRVEEVGGTLEGFESEAVQGFKPQGCVTGGFFCFSVPVSVEAGPDLATVIVDAPATDVWRQVMEYYETSTGPTVLVPRSYVGATARFSDGTEATWGESRCRLGDAVEGGEG